MKRSTLQYVAPIFMVTLLTSCAGAAPVASQWPPHPIEMNGHREAWQEEVSLREAGLTVSVSNDEDFIYISLQTSEERVRRQMLMEGFIVWIDPAGGSKEKFGVRYPLGAALTEPDLRPSGPPGAGEPPALSEMALTKMLAEWEILVDGDQRGSRLFVGEVPELLGKIQHDSDFISYELRIPIVRDPEATYGVEVASGSDIGIGLQTADRVRQGAGPKVRAGGMGAGRGGGGRRGGGANPGGGVPRTGRGSGGPEPVEAWIKVSLAKPS